MPSWLFIAVRPTRPLYFGSNNSSQLFGGVPENGGIRFKKADAPRIDNHGKERGVTKIVAEFVDVAAAVGDDAERETALGQFREQFHVGRSRFPGGRNETAHEMFLQLGVR